MAESIALAELIPFFHESLIYFAFAYAAAWVTSLIAAKLLELYDNEKRGLATSYMFLAIALFAYHGFGGDNERVPGIIITAFVLLQTLVLLVKNISGKDAGATAVVLLFSGILYFLLLSVTFAIFVGGLRMFGEALAGVS